MVAEDFVVPPGQTIFFFSGTTADPLNQSDMPSSSAIASNASVRQRDGEASFDEAGFCKREIVAQRVPNHSVRNRLR